MKFAAFTFATQNLGDDVQALAAFLFSRRLDALINRDSLAEAPIAETHACVFNSWFLVGQDFRAPSPLIEPILHSLCIGRDYLMKTAWRDYLASYGPVGARDTVTLDLLHQNGVDAYWSGCLTTFMGEQVEPVAERRGVLFIDIDEETETRFIPKSVSARAERLTNFIPPSSMADPLRRLSLCVDLIRRLASAELVVTRRLHVALPCVGLKTPVCVLPDPAIANARRRFAGYDWLPLRFKDDPTTGWDFDWDSPPVVEAPADMRTAHDTFALAMSNRGLLSPHKVDLGGAVSDTVTMKADLPARAGRVFLEFGQDRRELPVRSWSSSGLMVETPPLPIPSRLFATLNVTDADDTSLMKIGLRDALNSGAGTQA